MYKRFNQNQVGLKSFIYETTLTDMSDYLPKKINELKKAGWNVLLFYLWISSCEVSKQRVEQRVKSGGHGVKTELLQKLLINMKYTTIVCI